MDATILNNNVEATSVGGAFDEAIRLFKEIHRDALLWHTAYAIHEFRRRKKYTSEEEYFQTLKDCKYGEIFENLFKVMENENGAVTIEALDEFSKEILKDRYDIYREDLRLVEIKSLVNLTNNDTAESPVNTNTDEKVVDIVEGTNLKKEENSLSEIVTGLFNNLVKDAVVEIEEPVSEDLETEEVVEVPKAADKTADAIFNIASKFTPVNAEISVKKSQFSGVNSLYDLEIKENGNSRFYAINPGTTIPGVYSVIIQNSNGTFINVPLLDEHESYLKIIFTLVAPVLSIEDSAKFSQYLPFEDTSGITLGYVDYSDMPKKISKLSKEKKDVLMNNIIFTINSVNSTSQRNAKFRFGKFKDENEFELISDSKVKTIGLGSATDILGIKVKFKSGQDILVEKSDDNK